MNIHYRYTTTTKIRGRLVENVAITKELNERGNLKDDEPAIMCDADFLQDEFFPCLQIEHFPSANR